MLNIRFDNKSINPYRVYTVHVYKYMYNLLLLYDTLRLLLQYYSYE